MNNVFVYCELEGTTVAEVSKELLTKGRKLANTLGGHYGKDRTADIAIRRR